MEKFEISYETKYLETPLSEQEALESGDYCMFFRLDGQLVKKTCFYKHTFESIYWYTDILYGVSELLSRLRSEYPQGSIILVKREPYLDYTIETAHWYEEEDPVYTGGTFMLFNHLMQEIYWSSFDEKNQVDDECFKTYYDGINYYRFYYTETGELAYLYGWSEFQERLSPAEIEHYLPGFLQNNPYFATDTPFPEFYSKDSFVLKEKPAPVKEKPRYVPAPTREESFYRRYSNEIWLLVVLLIIVLVLVLR